MQSEWDDTPWAGDAVKAVRVTDENDWRMSWPLGSSDIFDHVTTASGVEMGPSASLRVATVYACVRVLAETLASVPLLVYRRLPNGGKERYTQHPLYTVLHDQPNPEMTSFVWRETMMNHLALWGNAYCEVTRDRFGQISLWPLRPDRMEVYYNKQGRRAYDYLTATGARQTMAPGSVFHVAGLSSNGLKGYSPIALHRETFGLAQVAQNFGSNFFRNNARPAIVMTHPKTLSPGAVERMVAQVEAMKGSGNAGKTVLLEEGLTVKEIGIPPEDAQYIETRKFQAEEIARLFRMQPHMVGILEHATFSNIEHQSIDFKTFTMAPWFARIEQELKLQLAYGEPDVDIEFEADGLLRGDAKSRAEALNVQRNAGVISTNEWRAIENRNPIEGGDDDFWRPLNMGVARGEDVAEEPPPVPPPSVDDTAPLEAAEPVATL